MQWISWWKRISVILINLLGTERKFNLRKNFFLELFSRVDVHVLNTIEKPAESLNRIIELGKR